MKHINLGGVYAIRLERGERVVECLTRFCLGQGIRSAYFHGIGTCRRAELGFFQTEKRRYKFRIFSGDHEIACLLGNVSLLKGKPFIHAHIVLAGSGFEAVGGHLKEAEVLATCEVFLRPLPGALSRKLDPESGLNLWEWSLPRKKRRSG